ncbi:UDP-3-O-[3-hydroxymyristoyl] N-acetylglucosamine deacetylase [Candidatus Sumerlaeota bacterium]|nr:UDP-3-O-[3-hydroxymyristoyl] N-acetylglucosamine deacetylase [Candidatus Sumerlaeota bacterium]
MAKEQTIRDSKSIEDIAVHTGRRTRITFLPAPPGSGIRFRRVDVQGQPEIPATINNVVLDESYRRTTLSAPNGVYVHTVEHLLSAIYAMEVDNLVIEIDGDEVPFTDGSALPYAEMLISAGIVSQPQEREVLAVDRPVLYKEKPDISVTALPWEEFAITFFVDYPNPIVGKQALHLSITPEIFLKEIAPARTYVFKSDLEEIHSLGLAKGGDLDRAIVIDEDKILNNEPLRFKDEIVRHKILDILGDLALIGKHIKAHIIGKKSGHRAHLHFVKKLKETLHNER